METGTRQPRSPEAHRSGRDDLAAGFATAAALAVPVRLCQAGAGQFSSTPKSAQRHGLGRRGRPRHEHCARHCGRARVPPCRVPARDRGAMGCGELEECADHQCRAGRLRYVSSSATRWRTHRGRRAAACPCFPTCPVRTLRNADPHWFSLHSADAGCTIGHRPQHRFASDRKFDQRHHRRHSPMDWQHMTACSAATFTNSVDAAQSNERRRSCVCAPAFSRLQTPVGKRECCLVTSVAWPLSCEEAGNCSTIARWPAVSRVTITVLPSGNSNAS